MRLLVTFVALLLLTSAGMALSWQDVAVARDGAAGARVLALVAGSITFASFLLLARIVYRISGPHRLSEEDDS